MQLEYLEHSFSTDQQSKILKQIQSINKKLIENAHFSKSNTNSNRSNQILLKKKQVDDKYFSQQCQQLFDDQSYNHKDKNAINDQQSLFNSKNELLLDNQYQKQVKYFKEFQTDKYASINRSKSNYSSKNKIKQTTYEKNNSFFKQNTPIQNTKPILSNKNQIQIKKLAQTKIKRFIQNKQNIFPSSYNIPSSSDVQLSSKIPAQNYNNSQKLAFIYSKNRNKQKSILKEVKNKIICDYLLAEKQAYKPQNNRKYTLTQRAQTLLTQPTQQSQQILNQQQENDSLELFQKLSKQPKYKFLQKDQNIKRKVLFKCQSNKAILQCTFKPNILKKSNDIAQNLQPSFERLTQDIGAPRSQTKLPYRTKQQISSKKYSCKRLQQLSQPRRLKTTVQDQQQQQYLFKPTLSKKSLQQMANCTLDIASRNKLWLQQKEAKICRLKTQEQENKLKRQSSSFAPKINNYKGQSQVHLSRFAKQGMSNYFERISMAKQRNSNFEKKKPQKQQKQPVNLNPVILKNKTYQQAVKLLHNKIMNMNL